MNRLVRWIALVPLASCAPNPENGMKGVDAPVKISTSGEELRARSVDGSRYSYPLATDFDPQEHQRIGSVTWRYDRQALYSVAAPERAGSTTFTYEGPPPPDSILDRLLGLVRYDSEGRVWVVEDVDLAAWLEVIGKEDAELISLGEPAPDRMTVDQLTELSENPPEYQIGEQVTFTPLSWSDGCDNVQDIDKIWDTEDRVVVTSLSTRQKASVAIMSDYSGPGLDGLAVCSGVLLNEWTVLTAAHCVSYCDGTDVITADRDVCAYGNAYGGAVCRTTDPTDIMIPGSYSCPHLTSDDDWAIINLQVAMPTSTSDFNMSQLGSIGSRDVFSLGFPALVPGNGQCAANVGIDQDHNYNAVKLYEQGDVNITDYIGAFGKVKMDAMDMQSGSPIFYCSGSDNDCDSTDTGMVAIVLSGFSAGINDRWAGPRVKHWREDMLAVIEHP